MPITALHASHIVEVNVGFVLAGPELDPASVSHALAMAPDSSARRGQARISQGGQPAPPWDYGWWRVNSASRVSSKDINAHFNALLAELLPHREAILRLARGGSTFFDVLWKSTYLYAGTGPLIEPACIRGIAALEAGVGFDIYSVEAPETEA